MKLLAALRGKNCSAPKPFILITPTEIFCLNELGRRRNNEDYVYPPKGKATLNDRLFIVCDGVGGEKKGEVASEIVCSALHEFFQRHPVKDGLGKEIIQKGIHYASEQLAAYVIKDQDAKRMSTTLALAFLGAQSVIAAWCGDTRIHHIRNGKVLWKSRDHSLVSELISQGELTEEEARSHPQRNVITRSLNALNYNNTVDFYEISDLESGDYLLLCSDGLLERIDEQLIQVILVDEENPDKAGMFLSYCDGLTRDNFSMYLVRLQNLPEAKRKSYKYAIFIFFVLLIISAFLVFSC